MMKGLLDALLHWAPTSAQSKLSSLQSRIYVQQLLNKKLFIQHKSRAPF